MSGNIQEHAARKNAVAPGLDRAVPRPVEPDLLRRVAPVPHPLLVPGVAERVDVGRRLAVIVHADEVDRPATVGLPLDGRHVVQRRRGVFGRRGDWERPAKRNGEAAPHQRRSLPSLLCCDQVDGPGRAAVPPPAPVAPVPEIRVDPRLRRYLPVGHSAALHPRVEADAQRIYTGRRGVSTRSRARRCRIGP